MRPDFSAYVLLLMKDDKELFRSNDSGLRPLMNCVDECKKYSGCILFDKVIGLAAARIIIHTRIISKVFAGVASEPAIELLEKNRIGINAGIIVKNILRQDRTDICPREKKAMTMSNKEFFNEMKKIYG